MEYVKIQAGRSRLAIAKTLTPDWFGWSGVAVMALLPAAKIDLAGVVWFFPMLSLGEWLLLPLGAASMIMGLLSLGRVKEKTLLPMWLAAVVPALVWLAGAGLAILRGGVAPAEGDMFLAWVVRLVFPTLAFLPLLVQRLWRNRLMWALLGGLAANIVLTAIQLASGAGDRIRFAGALCNQYDYSLALAVALPLLAAWRGGEIRNNRAFVILVCTFLLPAAALGACFTLAGLAAVAAGLAASWAAWRNPAWITGVFICLLLFGHGAENRREKDAAYRRSLVATAAPGMAEYGKAFEAFEAAPYFGGGPAAFMSMEARGRLHPGPGGDPAPWYATLLGGSGLAGLGLWLALMGEIAARVLGRAGRRCLWNGGVLGALAGLAVAGVWTDALPPGAGSLVGLLLAISILEEPETAPSPRRIARRHERRLEAVRRETAIRVREGGGS